MFEKLLAYRTRQRPFELAYILGNASVTYSRFDGDVNRAANRLRREGVENARLVGVRAANPYVHAVLMIALIRLNLPSVGLTEGWSGPDPAVMIAKPGLIVSDAAEEPSFNGRVLQLTRDWLEGSDADARDAPPLTPYRPDDLIRIVLSSGTTGMPKRIPLTRAIMDMRFFYMGLGRRARGGRAAMLMGSNTIGGFMTSTGVWFGGGTMVHWPKGDPGANLLLLQPSVMVMSPDQLRGLLEHLPKTFQPPPDLSIAVAGSILPQKLYREAARRLSPDFLITYGSTEAGGTANGPGSVVEINPLANGHVPPWVELQILGPDGEVLGPGSVGEIRVRGQGAVSGYLDDEEASSAAFRDGWFHPGDLGSIDPETGMLIVEGRVNEVMNLAGVKVSPSRLELLVGSLDGVRESAAFTVPDRQGLDTLWLAVAPSEGADFGEIASKVREVIGPQTAGVIRVEAIPRNPMGKIMRDQLREQARAEDARKPERFGELFGAPEPGFNF